jgi:hypothetical protein
VQTLFSNDPASLRSKAGFLQRLARASHSIPVREELEELSLKSMEEATALENNLADIASPKEIARTGAREKEDRR